MRLDLSPETRRRVALLFRPEDQEQAASLLANECGNNIWGFKRADERGMERVRFAAPKISGDLHKLSAAVDLPKLDLRDPLMSAGFPEVNDHEKWLPEKKW